MENLNKLNTRITELENENEELKDKLLMRERVSAKIIKTTSKGYEILVEVKQ